MSVINNGLLLGAGADGYQISRSVRLRSSATAYFNRTPASAGSLTTWTWSGWVKRGTLGSAQAIFSSGTSNITLVQFQANDTLRIRNSTVEYITTQVFRDPSAWYHIVVQWNTTNATAANRVLLYVNGVQVTSFSTQTTAASSEQSEWNKAQANEIGRYAFNGTLYTDGYLTEVNFIDGQALTPSSFGETNALTGVWQPKRYAGTYGTNGFYLNFSDNSGATATTIGKDYSGNGNNWTPNNISVTAGVTYDSMLDVPTQWADGGNGRGNYAVLNPVAPNPSTTASTCADGNLTASASAANTMRKATIGITSGAYYFEATLGSTVQGFGLGEAAVNSFGTNSASTGARTYYLYNGGANLYTILPSADTSITTTVGSGGTLAVAVDMTNKKLWLGYAASGGGSITWIGGGSPSAGTSPTHTFASDVSEVFPLALTNGPALYCNFGQRPFTYTPPTGFVALNTQNLPEPTIKKGNQYFDATTYTGTSASNAVVNASGFQPDLVWLKNRNYGSGTNHVLVDAVRGASLGLASNLTNADFSTSGNFSSINSNGFTVTGTARDYNFLNDTFVGWQWKESPSAGFDIVTYTGTGANRTVAHSLGVAPAMVIVKDRTTAGNWPVYHVSIGATNAIYLNLTNASGATSTAWNNTAPTSSVFSLGTSTLLNGSGDNYVAYLFAEVAGYSKFGKYTGNGSADGSFVYLGFRPRWVMFKRTDTTSNWLIIDSVRGSYNADKNRLFPNLSNAEDTSENFDFLSNGFKLRDSAGSMNASGGTYIFAAFAENPFKHSLAR